MIRGLIFGINNIFLIFYILIFTRLLYEDKSSFESTFIKSNAYLIVLSSIFYLVIS